MSWYWYFHLSPLKAKYRLEGLCYVSCCLLSTPLRGGGGGGGMNRAAADPWECSWWTSNTMHNTNSNSVHVSEGKYHIHNIGSSCRKNPRACIGNMFVNKELFILCDSFPGRRAAAQCRERMTWWSPHGNQGSYLPLSLQHLCAVGWVTSAATQPNLYQLSAH